MSLLQEIYELPEGVEVEIQLKETKFRGQLKQLVTQGAIRNPQIDQVQLHAPTELPSGKQINTPVSFPVNSIMNINVLEFGIFKSRHESDSGSLLVNSNTSNGEKGKISSKKRKGKLTEGIKDLRPVEITFRTYMIQDESKLKQLLKLLKEDSSHVCGLSLEGQNIGRNGVVAWIVLTAGKTLIPIDIDSLAGKVPNLWETLGRDLFSNPKLVKVMHDSRPPADYLFHSHGIQMVNIFDTQVADVIVSYEASKCAPSQLKLLSDSLQLYNRRIPPEEIEFLRKFEIYDFSTNSPMLRKPLPSSEFLKLCALKVKHLIPLRENLLKKMMEKMTRCTEAHMDSFRNLSTESFASVSLPENITNPSEELQSLIIN